MEGFQGLTSLNFYPSLGALDTCWFSQLLRCLQVDGGLPHAFHWSRTDLGNLGCSPESLAICPRTFQVRLP